MQKTHVLKQGQDVEREQRQAARRYQLTRLSRWQILCYLEGIVHVDRSVYECIAGVRQVGGDRPVNRHFRQQPDNSFRVG